MAARGLNSLARLVKYGLAGEATRDELARQTILLAGSRVAKLYHATLQDHQDATMEAAERAFARIDTWNPTRGGWSTFVAICVRSVIRDRLNKYNRESAALDALRKMP